MIKSDKKNIGKRFKIKGWISENSKSYFILLFCVIVTTSISFYLYRYTQNLLYARLQERLIAITSTASILFDENDINKLVQLGKDSVYSEEYKKTVLALQKLKRRNPDIRYTYIFAGTKDPNTVIFVADGDIIGLLPELNYTGEEIDNSDWIGSEYDVTEIEVLASKQAFETATTDIDLVRDEWGVTFSGYAPIRNQSWKTSNAIIGIDVDVTDYIRLVNATFIPFLGFVLLLIILLFILAISLILMWGSRVHLLQDLDRQKDELLSIVSHQLATPVASVKWYVEMLLDGDLGVLSKELKEHIGSMQSIAANLSDLVSMILDVSRIQLGRMKIERQELDLDAFFKEILETIDPKALEKKVNFAKSIPKKLPIAMLDKRYTRMTIENLLTNAIKYTPEGGKVTMNVELRDKVLYCEVKDTGVGIPKQDQDKIFGKLFRASNVRNSIDGNGFGLYVAKGAIESQGGKIWFESEEGKGTAFFIELPLEGAQATDKK